MLISSTLFMQFILTHKSGQPSYFFLWAYADIGICDCDLLEYRIQNYFKNNRLLFLETKSLVRRFGQKRLLND